MKLDPVRKARQVEIIKKWYSKGSQGTAECVTGFGKTILALMLIKKAISDGIKDVLVIVPTLFLQDQWEEKLKHFDIEGVEVVVINTAVKSEHKVGLLVLDEIHMYTAEIFGQIFDRVYYQMILGLTATLDVEDEKAALINKYAPIVDTVTFEEALKNNWISDFIVYNLAVDITDKEKALYRDLSVKFGKQFSYFNHNFALAMSCLNNPQECILWGRHLKRTEVEVKRYAINFARTMRQRKDLLYDSPSKIALAKELVDKFNKRKIITFSQTVQSAENIAEVIGDEAVAYHSSMKGHIGINFKKCSGKKAREDAIIRFTTNNAPFSKRVLCTAKALDMGADLPEIDMAIIISSTSKTRQGTQRYGRTLRFIAGKMTIIVELYIPDTQDERWLRSRQERIPKELIRWVNSVEDIGS